MFELAFLLLLFVIINIVVVKLYQRQKLLPIFFLVMLIYITISINQLMYWGDPTTELFDYLTGIVNLEGLYSSIIVDNLIRMQFAFIVPTLIQMLIVLFTFLFNVLAIFNQLER
jgi:hypothetical protein